MISNILVQTDVSSYLVILFSKKCQIVIKLTLALVVAILGAGTY
jgi:hypothetical protein